MLLDGLEDAYETGKPMGAFAEETARSYQIGRAAQDEYALRSLERARAAQACCARRISNDPGRNTSTCPSRPRVRPLLRRSTFGYLPL